MGVEPYAAAQGDVEFGGLGIDEVLVGSWGSFWKKIGGGIKAIFKGAAKSDMVKDAINAYQPGAGDAMQKGIQLIEAGKAGNPEAIAQIKSIADAAKAGDKAKQGAHDMLKTINDARNEAKAEGPTVAVGKKYKVKMPDGTTKTFKNKQELDAYLAAIKARRGQQQRPGTAGQPARGAAQTAAQRAQQLRARPVTRPQVAQAIKRVPPQNRPALMQGILAQQQQNMQQGMPFGMQPPYGVQSPYGIQPPPYGSPYGIQPFGYSYGPDYGDPGYPPDYGDYEGDSEAELAAAFAEDVSYPDEASVQG